VQQPLQLVAAVGRYSRVGVQGKTVDVGTARAAQGGLQS
jgi:hypothetical protein